MIKFFFGYHDDALKNYEAPKLCTVYVVKSPVLGLQRAPENSELALCLMLLSSVANLMHYHLIISVTSESFQLCIFS